MKICIKVGGGKKDHAADYDSETGAVSLFCDSMTYATFYALVVDFTPPSVETVTCKKCLKNKGSWLK